MTIKNLGLWLVKNIIKLQPATAQFLVAVNHCSHFMQVNFNILDLPVFQQYLEQNEAQ